MEVMMKNGFKQTEVGLIPEDWEVTKFEEKFSILVGGDVDLSSFSTIKDSQYKYPIYANSVTNNGLYGYSSKSTFNGDSLTVTGRGIGIGTAFTRNGFYNAVGRLIVLKPIMPINVKFVAEYINNYIDIFSESSGIPQLTGVSFSKYKIPLPPTLAEQAAIATALSDVDDLIANLDQLITKKKAMKQGAMQQLLTPPHKGGKRLDGFSGEWMEKRLGDVAKINMGQSPLSSNYNNTGIGLPLVQGNADIKERKTIIRNYTSQITKVADIGDVIMSVRAPVGEIALAAFDCCIGRGVCSLKYPNDFLYHYLIFFESSWGRFSTGSTFDSINSDQLKNLEMAIPSTQEEQKAIAQILSVIDAEIEQLETKKAKYQGVKQGMMQELLTGKTRLV